MILWILGILALILVSSLFRSPAKPSPVLPVSRPASSWDAEKLRCLDQEIGALQTCLVFPACITLSPLLIEASEHPAALRRHLSWADVDGVKVEAGAAFKEFAADPVAFREAAVQRVIQAELTRHTSFLDTVEKQPLTAEQRLAVVSEEDATLVLAGAGSGKTSVITAKAAYLVKAGIRKPEEILLLAFARDAAQEMSTRIRERTGLDVTARTFHALAYDILGAVEGSKPALAAHASDDKAFFALLREILQEMVAAGSVAAAALIAWFSWARLDVKSELDFKTKHDWYHHVERLNLRTLQGERVKSFEELMIANWLYVNGIAYDYEPLYPHKLPASGRKVYTPDFWLKESDVYIEHFGVRRVRGPRGEEKLVTAPYIDRDEYLEGMAWKRGVHASCGTTLVETYSYDRDEGLLTDRLAERLAPHVRLKPRPPQEIYDRVAEMGQVDSFISLLGTFLRHFKSSGLTLADCRARSEKEKMGARGRAFLAVFEAAYTAYQAELGQRIDFEDMILKATSHVEAGTYQSPFRHILVDEFQDISRSRSGLITALKAQQPGTRLFAVGDDWQSIYRFAGADMQVMTSFAKLYGGTYGGRRDVHRIVDLGRTFRSVDKIAFAARRFVLKNPVQMKKQIVPAGTTATPALKVILTQRQEGDAPLRQHLATLVGQGPTSVLLLARYNRQAPDLAALRHAFPGITIDFKTIHRAKGLEADHVILLGAEAGQYGFPSSVTDDPLLNLVMPTPENFTFAEERRVMYVAMTRARKTFTILAPEARPSEFVEELLKDPGYEAETNRPSSATLRVCGECGGRLIQVALSGGGLRFRCEHTVLCGNDLSACTSCGAGLPRRGKNGEMSQCPRCAVAFPACPACNDGWLLPRSSRFGDFLGCVRYPVCSGKVKGKRG